MAALGSNMKGRSQEKENKPKLTAKPKKKVAAKTSKPKPVSAKSKVVPKEKPKAVVKKKPVKSKAKSVTQQEKKLEQEPVKLENVLSTSTVKKETVAFKNELREAKLILEPSKRRKIRKIKVIMEGELNINNVDAFTEQIHPIFKDFDFVDFLLREPSSVDLAHIQMLYYFQEYYAAKGKTITIDSNVSTETKKIIISSGFKDLMFIPKLV